MQKDVTVTVERPRAAPPRRAGPPTPAGRRGFTLMEVSVILGLVSVLTVVSVTAVGPLRTTLQRHEAFQRVATAVANARQLAISSGDCVYVELLGGYSAATRSYGSPVTTTGIAAEALRIRRLPLANCAQSTLYGPNPDDHSSAVRHIETIDMPYTRGSSGPDSRTFRAALIATDSGGMASPPSLPIIFRPNGRVHGRTSTDVINLFVLDPANTSDLTDRRIQISGHGRVCVYNDQLAGEDRCD